MAIDFSKTFGKNNAGADKLSKDDRPKAQLWLNIGYVSDAIDPETGERRFVAMPTGIPLDTQERLDTKMRNREFAAFQAARNDVLDQCIAVGEKLDPGQSVVIETESGLAIQIRRVGAELEEATADSSNMFRRDLKLVG